jgi:hypothetical protein
VLVAWPSSGGPEVRDDRWSPSISRARREGEGGAAGGVFLWGRWQFGGAPPARGPAERPRPSGKRGSGRLERKKRMGHDWAERPDGPEVTGKILFRIKFDFCIYHGFGNLHKEI